MIIKSTRIRARGGAAKRLLDHVARGEENEAVVSLRGTERDVLDAFDDARLRGREYGVRHWIIAPERQCSREDMLGVVDALGKEFGFDAALAYVKEHQKARAYTAAFDRHLHVVVAEVDPVSGRCLGSSHSFARQEKVSRLSEYALGHPFTPGAHNSAVAAALRKEGRQDVASMLDRVVAGTPSGGSGGYTHAAQQRAKRQGLDLPALQKIVLDAWQATQTRADLESVLSEYALTLKTGKKPGVYMVETVNGEDVGSLARLVRARKAAILTRMESERELNREAGEERRGEGACRDAGPSEPDGAGGCAGAESAGAGRLESVGHDDRDSASDARSGGASAPVAGAGGSPSQSASGGESRKGGFEELINAAVFRLAVEADARIDALHALLAESNRLALSPAERASRSLQEVVEFAEHAHAMVATPPGETSELTRARVLEAEAKDAVATAQREVSRWKEEHRDARRATTGPWWRQMILRMTRKRSGLLAKVEVCRVAEEAARSLLTQAEFRCLSAQRRVTAGERQHRLSVESHTNAWRDKSAEANGTKAAAREGFALIAQMPGLVHTGVGGILALGRRVVEARGRSSDRNLNEDWHA